MSATGRSEAAQTGHVRHVDDFYSTPAWCTRAILPHLEGGIVLDPCCGSGAILDVVAKEWDVGTYGYELDKGRATHAAKSHAVDLCDALASHWSTDATIITNPPYALAMPFVERALAQPCKPTCAFLLRLNWLGSQKRAAFHRANPSDVYALPKRPSFTTDGKTDATEYAWFVWGPGRGGRWSILEIDP